ncbi:hypothetical protein IFM47457_02480 [Aspergillus lentulus]|nr:hypothetical protein IFM47457_02480 [Aspergillus lentulus]
MGFFFSLRRYAHLCSLALRQGQGLERQTHNRISLQGPLAFNKACCTLLGGSFYILNSEDNERKSEKTRQCEWPPRLLGKPQKDCTRRRGMRQASTALQGTSRNDGLLAMRVEDIDGFEVTAVIPSHPGVREFYRG